MTDWVDVAGWTLLHFLWQGAVIAATAAVALRLLHGARPQIRYAVGCAALTAMLVAPIGTALVLTDGPMRAPIIGSSIHLLRTAQGSVTGVAITPAVIGGPAIGAPAAPIELRLPSALDADTLMPTVVTLWLAGVALLLVRLAVAGWRVRRLIRMARREPLSRWQASAEDIARRLTLRARFVVVDSMRVSAPTVVGWLRPVVLLPVAALAGLSPQQVHAILAHELAHIRRHDFIVNLLQTFAETALFYHPAVWWVSRRIRAEREHCCDDVAVAVCGDATEYAKALAELASWSIAHTPLVMAATRGPLIRRIRRVLNLSEPADHSRRRNLFLVAGVITTVTVVGGLGVMVRAQPLATGPGGGVGPAQVNQVLGYELFPGPVRLPTDDPAGVRSWGVKVTGGGREMAFIGFTARSLIREAYDLGTMPIVDAPQWMDRETFDVVVPADFTIVNGLADTEQVRAALRQFLEGTLGLATHRATRDFPAYALGRVHPEGSLGPAIRPSTRECFDRRPAIGPNPNAPPIVGPMLRSRAPGEVRRLCGIEDTIRGFIGVRATMAELAIELGRRGHPLMPDREVVDRTGLEGAFDFELRFGFLPLAAVGYANPTFGAVLHPFGFRNVFTALPEQLGVKLVDASVSHEVLVIDRIERP